jgi:hypothetical protein
MGKHTLWLEAEQFGELGGWTVDGQFIDQMGSPYLLAAGMGRPVGEAVTRVRVPEAGAYRLWVRCKDWAPECGPGRFEVLVGGRRAGVFGASGKEGWVWEKGEVEELEGTVEVRLRDLTGEYGRCDVVVLTSDRDWVPPDDLAELRGLREEHGGVRREAEPEAYDVVVVGGGLAGCMAAVAAARLGARTALIHDRPVLGGNASTECLVPPVGVWLYDGVDPRDPLETGIIEEVRASGRQLPEEAKLYSPRLLALCEAEPNLDLHLHSHVTGVAMEGPNRIAAVEALCVPTGGLRTIRGRVFIDCTGDGSLGAWAGAEFRHGREPRAMYGETFAPVEGDAHTMGCGLKYGWEEAGEAAAYEPPVWARTFERCEEFTPQRHPRLTLDDWQWRIEIGGMQDVIAEAEEIRDELLCIIYGLWDHTKNRCPEQREQAANLRLSWVTHVLAKRESRRILGPTVMTEHDIIGQTLFPDRVAYGAWGIDDHPPGGFYHDGPTAAHGYHNVPFSIPYGSLRSKDIGNLLMAGRCISVSHVALAATRVMLTNATMGQAAGTAAALHVKHGMALDDYATLQQQLLKDGCYIIDLPNADPDDLARGTKVTASSEAADAPAGKVIDGFARFEHGEAHSWRPAEGVELPQWIELDVGEGRSVNGVYVTFQTKALAARAFRIEAWREGRWDTVAEVEGNERRRCVVGFERTATARVRVVVEEAREGFAVCEVRVYDEGTATACRLEARAPRWTTTTD